MNKLFEGMKLILKEDLVVGMNIIKKDSMGKIIDIMDRGVSIEIQGVGIGVFSKEELSKYFEKYDILNKYEDIHKYIVNGRVVIVILKNGIKGVARCLEEDNFNKDTGISIAYLKAKRKEINKQLKKY